MELGYIRNKNKQEVDFAISKELGELEKIFEVKLSDGDPSASLKYFAEKLQTKGTQIVRNIRHSYVVNERVQVREAKSFLNDLFL